MGTGRLFVGVVLSVVVPAVAHSNPIVVESYGGARPDDASQILSPLYKELARKGYSGAAELSTRVERDLSQTGETLSPEQISALRSLTEHGYSAFINGDFDVAIEELGRVLAQLRSRPATVPQSPDLRDVVIRAQIGISLAHQRLGNAEKAVAEMAEFLRSHPDREISRKQYGPEPAELAKKVRAELEQRARGSLSIDVVDDPGGVVFVNERYVSIGKATLSDLFPGRYRVYIGGRRGGRVHDVEVASGDSKQVQIRLANEAPLRTGADHVALEFTDEEQRADQEPPVAAALGTALRAGEVAVVSIRNINGRRAVVGTVVAVDTARTVRSASVGMEPVAPGDQQLVALARFLASGEKQPGLDIDGDRVIEPAHTASRPRARAWYGDTWGWVLTGAGVATAATGAFFLMGASSLDSDAEDTVDETERQDLLDEADGKRTLGMILVPVGVTVLAAGVLKLAWTDKPPSRESDTRMAFGPNWVGVEGSF